MDGFKFKNSTVINAGNSGTLARLMFGLLINAKNEIILKGDKSLSKRDFQRIIKPMEIFGQNIKSRNRIDNKNIRTKNKLWKNYLWFRIKDRRRNYNV